MPSIRHTRDCHKPWRLLGVMGLRFLCALVLASAALSALPSARAQSSPAAGFQVNRYEPTAAGEWGFLVDHPYYSSTRYFAGGITLNYGHNPLVRRIFSADGSLLQTDAILAHQLIGHVDLAGSFLDRVTVSLSLPVTLLEQGQSLLGVTPTSPAVGDPRIGAMVRVFGQPDASPISLSVGGGAGSGSPHPATNARIKIPAIRRMSKPPNLQARESSIRTSRTFRREK